MKIFQNISAKKSLKNMNESLLAVFESTTPENFKTALDNAIKIHEKAEKSLSDDYLFPESKDKNSESVLFSKNVWANIDTIRFLEKLSDNVIADTLIYSIGSFYIQNDKHMKMLFANFVLDGLIMAQNHYKSNWVEYMSRYFEIQSNVTSFIESYLKNSESWSKSASHPFSYQYPPYYYFTSYKEARENTDIIDVTHYDRALIKIALLNLKTNKEKSEQFIKQAISLYGAEVVMSGEMKYFLSPLNSSLYENDDDRLNDYSFITNTIEKFSNSMIA